MVHFILNWSFAYQGRKTAMVLEVSLFRPSLTEMVSGTFDVGTVALNCEATPTLPEGGVSSIQEIPTSHQIQYLMTLDSRLAHSFSHSHSQVVLFIRSLHALSFRGQKKDNFEFPLHYDPKRTPRCMQWPFNFPNHIEPIPKKKKKKKKRAARLSHILRSFSVSPLTSFA